MALRALSIGKSECYHTLAQRSITHCTMLNPHRHGPHPDKAPRFDRHYTRRNRTSPLWAGLEQASVGRFKKRRKAITLAPGAEKDFTTISVHRLPPLPPLHEPISQNVRLRQASFSGLMRDLYPRTAQSNQLPLPMFLHVLSTCLTDFRQAALPLLHVDDYHSLRLTCRFIANLLPGFQPERLMNLGPYSSHLSRQCRNTRHEGRRSVTQTHEYRLTFQGTRESPPPNLYYYPYNDTERPRCTRVHGLDPQQWWWPSPLAFRVCDGTKMGLNHDFHAPNFTICALCAHGAYFDEEHDRYHPNFTLPLCFDCSQDKIQSPDWQTCVCDEIYRPLTPDRYYHGDYFLCTRCRQELKHRWTRTAMARCEEIGVAVRGGWEEEKNDSEEPDMRKYVDDWDYWHRSTCICGKTYREIGSSYPVHPVTGNPQYDRMFKMCLLCGLHKAGFYRPRGGGVCYH